MPSCAPVRASAASLIMSRGEVASADAGSARLAHDVADDEVGGAVVDVADLREVFGQVGRLRVALVELVRSRSD